MFGGVSWHTRPYRPVATILPQARPQGEMGGHSATSFGVTTGAGCRVVQAPKPDGALACEPRFDVGAFTAAGGRHKALELPE